MRITNSMLVNNLMNNLNANLTRMDKLQNQMATGRKFAHISDDPVALIYSQTARNKIARLTHYQTAVGTARDWLNQAEVGILELQEILTHAIEAAVDAASDVKTDGDRQNIAKTVLQMRDHFVDTLNATYGDKYVYGGYNTTGDPSAADPTLELLKDGAKPFVAKDIGDGNGMQLYYNGFNLSKLDKIPVDDYYAILKADTFPGHAGEIPPGPCPDGWTADDFDKFKILAGDILTFDLGPGIGLPVTMNGIELLFFPTPSGEDGYIIRNAYNVLHEVYEDIEFGSPAAKISAMIKPLQDGQNHLLSKTAEIGGRIRRLDLLEARYEQDEINYARMRSDAEDVDMAEVIMYQKMAEAVYQAALSAGARIIQPTLMDFLR